MLAGEKDPFVGYEHVVEDHEAFRRVVAAGDRKVPLVFVTRRVGGVDDLHPRRVHRHHGRHGVLVLAGLHGLGGNRHELVTHGRRGDVELRTANDDAVIGAPDHPHELVRIVLIPGPTAAIALGIGDALGDAHVAFLGVRHPGPDAG